MPNHVLAQSLTRRHLLSPPLPLRHRLQTSTSLPRLMHFPFLRLTKNPLLALNLNRRDVSHNLPEQARLLLLKLPFDLKPTIKPLHRPLSQLMLLLRPRLVRIPLHSIHITMSLNFGMTIHIFHQKTLTTRSLLFVRVSFQMRTPLSVMPDTTLTNLGSSSIRSTRSLSV
jgi:hypothetical protein